MRLEQIEIFLELAKELHFWRTSEKVFITQSALSRRIQALEEDLGFRLFERNKRRVKLTAAGEFMRVEWERILEEIGNIHRQAKQISRGEIGTVRIGHPGSITYSFLPDLLLKVTREYPDLKIELIEISAFALEGALLNYKIDIGFNRDPSNNEHLISKLYAQDNFALFVPENHRLQSGNFTGFADLSTEKFILPPLKGGSQYVGLLNDIFRSYNFTPKVYIESEFGATILSLVAKGLGISLMPVSYSLQSPRGVRVIELPHKTNLYAVWRKHDEAGILQNLLKFIEN